MAEAAFWIALLFVLYVYLGYPLIIALWKRLAGRPTRKAAFEPPVTLILVAHNEKTNIRKKIDNCLALDYPKRRIEILVSLDGPTDGTEILMFRLASQGVHLLYSPQHKGKAAALNNAVERATGEILVFVDARQALDLQAVRELVANFADSQVGAVSGELILVDAENKVANDGVGLYWRYETSLRAGESLVHSVIGVTGAIYAIRKELFPHLTEKTILDDVAVPMAVVLAGHRVIFDSSARVYDQAVLQPETEYRRKVRTLAGNFQLLAIMPELLLPWKNPVFFQFVSHKLLRLFVPYALVLLYLSNIFLRRNSYGVFLVLQTIWYGCALIGYFACTEASHGTKLKEDRT